jgi:hypothetical protein
MEIFGFNILFIAIITCQIYGLFKGLTSGLALTISVLSAIYGIILLGSCAPFFGIIWLIIAAFYFKNYKELY